MDLPRRGRQRPPHPPAPLSLTPANTAGDGRRGVNGGDGPGAWFVARNGERLGTAVLWGAGLYRAAIGRWDGTNGHLTPLPPSPLRPQTPRATGGGG